MIEPCHDAKMMGFDALIQLSIQQPCAHCWLPSLLIEQYPNVMPFEDDGASIA